MQVAHGQAAWFVLTSFKSPAEITAIPPAIVPTFHWGFYRSAVADYGLLRYIGNSAAVAGATTLISIAIGALAAYALTRFRSSWGRLYLIVLLAVSMFPQIAVLPSEPACPITFQSDCPVARSSA